MEIQEKTLYPILSDNSKLLPVSSSELHYAFKSRKYKERWNISQISEVYICFATCQLHKHKKKDFMLVALAPNQTL